MSNKIDSLIEFASGRVLKSGIVGTDLPSLVYDTVTWVISEAISDRKAAENQYWHIVCEDIGPKPAGFTTFSSREYLFYASQSDAEKALNSLEKRNEYGNWRYTLCKPGSNY